MCPDPQLISIYLDGELPSPWKEKLEDHCAQCSQCADKLRDFKRLSQLFNSGISGENNKLQESAQQESEAKERVWNKIETNRRFMPRHTGVLRRRISIPLPAVAAAAVFILLLTVFYIQAIGNSGRQQTENTTFSLAAEINEMDYDFDYPGLYPGNFVLSGSLEKPVSDMSGVLQYLSPNMGASIIILQLPESKSFFRSGEPAIIRAADYTHDTRRQP